MRAPGKQNIRMMLTKRKQYIRTLTDVRFWIAINRLKLPRLGRLDNLIRICQSDLSWQKRIEWAKRISSYTGSRQETLEYYTVLYNDSTLAAKKMAEKRSKIMGEKNPWAKHGGKLSPFKKGSVNYSDAAVENANRNRSYNTTIEYWLNKGMGLCQAKAAVKNRQAVGRLDKFIERYGAEEGTRRWQDRQRKWQDTLNAKPPEEKARINSLKCSQGYSVSKAERELFTHITASGNIAAKKSLSLPYNNGHNYYVYDIAFNNKIIEYNGDIWHANPAIYDETFINPISKLDAKSVWAKEKHKEEIANLHGYEILRVWESDYKKNKQKVITECINFLIQ